MGLGPVFATSKPLTKTGIRISDLDLLEFNEAFAAQVLANLRAFASKRFASEFLGRGDCVGEIDESRLNVNGGAIALGRLGGATGVRLALTQLRELRRRGRALGLATLRVGGGQGPALLLESAG